MRQDPDIIMVGEIRDLETAEMAIQAALTGHLVLSTLHTNDAPSAITRLLDLGVPPYLLSATLIGVMAQRLVRTLCESCKEPVDDLPDEDWNGLIAPFPPASRRSIGRPCLECRMTVSWPQRALQLLPVDAGLRELISDKPISRSGAGRSAADSNAAAGRGRRSPASPPATRCKAHRRSATDRFGLPYALGFAERHRASATARRAGAAAAGRAERCVAGGEALS
jgi:hypothetical protein